MSDFNTPQCELYRWCFTNHFKRSQIIQDQQEQCLSQGSQSVSPSSPLTKLAPPEISHLLMDGAVGGSLCIPATRNTEFLRLFADEVRTGTRMYICEQRTPVFKFYFDLDIKRKEVSLVSSSSDVPSSHLPTFVQNLDTVSLDAMITQYCKDMQETLRLFFPEGNAEETKEGKDKFRMIVCRRENVLLSNEPKQLGIGVHVIMPHLLVNSHQALVMRGAAVFRFKEMYGTMDSVQNSWEDIVDEAVYVGSGLRMLGTRKMVKCRNCKNDALKKEVCNSCMGSGKEDVGRIYKPWKVFSGSGKEDQTELRKLQTILEYQMDVCSIRVFEHPETPGWKTYAGCPSATFDNENVVEMEVDGKKVRTFKEDMEVLNKIRKKIILPYDEAKHKAIEIYIRQMINPVYAKLTVDHIFTNDKCTWFIVNVRGDNDRYCMNVNREHKNNHVYFLVKEDGIYQKCYCRCNEMKGRQYGLCKDYVSKKYTITTRLKSLFFKYEDDKKSPEESFVQIDARSQTLKRQSVHVHMKSVDRTVGYLRSWLREKHEERCFGGSGKNRREDEESLVGDPNKKKRKRRVNQVMHPSGYKEDALEFVVVNGQPVNNKKIK